MNYNNLFPVVAYPTFQEGGVTTPVPVPAPTTVPVEPDKMKPVYDNPVYGRGIPYRTKQKGGSIEGGLKIGKSRIEGAGKGLFSNRQFKKDELIGLAHSNNQPVSDIGKMHNHSDNPNMYSVKQGNERYVYAKRDIGPDEELTTDYRMQPELEQPEDFKKGGSIPRLPNKSKKGVNSKAYSRSLEATNRLFAKNSLFEVPKSRKRKIYDPNAKYYQSGGSISFDFDDTLNTDLGLQMAQSTPITDRYIISARPEVTPDMLQRAYEAGVPQDRIFAMGSDEAKIAKVRELGIDRHVDNKQSVVDSLGPTGQLFQDGGFIETELTEEEIQAYRDGGYVVEELSENNFIKAQSGGGVKPYTTSNWQDYLKRQQAYDDSLTLHTMGNQAYEKTKNVKTQKDLDKWRKESSAADSKVMPIYVRLGFPYPSRVPKMKRAGAELLVIQYAAPKQRVVYSGPAPQNNKPVLQDDSITRLQPKPIEKISTPEKLEMPTFAPAQPKRDIRTASRSQTVMEPDPNNPGRYKVKELRTVPYSAYFEGEGWQPLTAPTMMWIDEQGNEVSYDPRKVQGPIASFQDGGFILELSPDEFDDYVKRGYIVEELD
jgi:hypothetical protein